MSAPFIHWTGDGLHCNKREQMKLMNKGNDSHFELEKQIAICYQRLNQMIRLVQLLPGCDYGVDYTLYYIECREIRRWKTAFTLLLLRLTQTCQIVQSLEKFRSIGDSSLFRTTFVICYCRRSVARATYKGPFIKAYLGAPNLRVPS